jgi:hypothetical protein
VFPPAVLPVLVARCGVGFFWLVGSGGGFAPPRWLAPAVFPVPARWVAPLAVGVPKARFLYEASYKKAAVRLLWWAVVFRALLGCWSRQVVLSPFLGCVCVLPFPYFIIIARIHAI